MIYLFDTNMLIGILREHKLIVLKYKQLPASKRIHLDSVWFDARGYKVTQGASPIQYGVLRLITPTLGQIHNILEEIAKSPSHFGSPTIEGLVIKNYEKQLFGKWINDGFEDKLND